MPVIIPSHKEHTDANSTLFNSTNRTMEIGLKENSQPPKMDFMEMDEYAPIRFAFVVFCLFVALGLFSVCRYLMVSNRTVEIDYQPLSVKDFSADLSSMQDDEEEEEDTEADAENYAKK